MEFNPNQFANPTGEEGVRLTKHMNIHHSPLTEWGLSHLELGGVRSALDVGCGGGNTIRLLSKSVERLSGVDISHVSVMATKETNEQLYTDGRLEVQRADAKNLPFANESFDLVTAVETVYFWKDILVCFNEVNRVLKKGGTFCMIFETYACEEKHEYNMQLKAQIQGYNVYSPEQLHYYLEDSGFSDVIMVMHDKESWLTVLATK